MQSVQPYNIVYNTQVLSFKLENEATQRRECDDALKKLAASHATITSDTHDQFRLFYVVERFVQSPPILARQMLLQISPDVQDMLIEKYASKKPKIIYFLDF